MRKVLLMLGLAVTVGVIGIAGDGSVAWPTTVEEEAATREDQGLVGAGGVTGSSESGPAVSFWGIEAIPWVHHEGLVHLSADDFFSCYFIGCACESNMRACCREKCCFWTCWFIPWMCDCFYIITCYWVPNCYTSPVLPMKVEPVGGER